MPLRYSIGIMPTTYLTHARNTRGRDFAVGDIHGCFQRLQQVLDGIGFDRATDRLFSLGDLVNRGPDSRQVLHWLDQPWFHAICGNHDFMIWRDGLGDPFPNVDHRLHGGDWFVGLPAAERRAIAERLQQLPVVAEVDTADGPVGLLHAECPFDDWQHLRDRPLEADNLHTCLWARWRIRQGDNSVIENIRAVAHGHNTIDEARVLGNRYYLDTGGWMSGRGHFSLLQLDTLELLRWPAATR